MKTGEFNLAMGQVLVEGGEPDKNLGRAQEMISDAASRGCDAIVLPECLDLGWTHPCVRQLAQTIPGPYSDVLCRAARKSGIHVVAGLTERDGNRTYNAAILVSDVGEIILKHRKINVLKIAQDIYSTGNSLSVAETRLGTIGVNICSDNFFDSLAIGHSLARMGAQVLLSPCAWAVDADFDNEKTPYGATWVKPYTTLAALYDMTVVGVSNVGLMNAGVWKGRKCIGCSLAVGPGGKIIAKGPFGENAEALLTVTLRPVPRTVTGTEIAQMLKQKGYEER